MPALRTRTERLREATKKNIVGVLMDATNNNSTYTTTNENNSNNSMAKPTTSSSAAVVDGSNETHISMLVEDLQKGLTRQLDNIKTDMLTCQQEQLQAHYSGMMKIPKMTREMTIADFNQKYNCNLLEVLQSARSNNAGAGVAKAMPVASCGKRERGLQTPAPYRGNRPMMTPTTAVRTVRKGEVLYSQNGSPVDAIDEGALVATVTKKRRGNITEATGANFDINVGEGRYISLNDPNGVQHLDSGMKTSALSQLKVLQDQMASLMQQLSTTDAA